MKVVALVCPQCGGNIDARDGTTKCFCPYCGTELHLDDETIRIENHVYDEARLRELQMADEADDEYEQHHKDWRRIMVAWIAIFGGLFAVDMVFDDILPGIADTAGTLAACALLFGGIAVAVLHPKRPQTMRSHHTSTSHQRPRSEKLSTETSSKDRVVAIILCVLFGYLGVHHFYVRKYIMGVVYLFTGGLFLIGWVVDIVRLARGTFCDSDGLPLEG